MARSKQGGTVLILPCYEKLCQDMGFDPQAAAPQMAEFEPWDLDKHYPRTLRERVAALAEEIGWDGQRLEQEKEWMQWLHEQERSEQDEQIPQNTQALGHLESSPGSGVAEGNPERDSEVGQGGADGNREDGPSQPIPGGGDPQAPVGGLPAGHSQEAD